MSVIVRKRNDTKIMLLTKGADLVMLPRLGGLSPKEISDIEEELY